MRKSMNHFTLSPSQAIANAPLEINRYPIVSSATWYNNNIAMKKNEQKKEKRKGRKEQNTKNEKSLSQVRDFKK